MQKKRTFKSFKLNLWKSSESDWISANLADWVCSLRGEITKSGVLATFRCSFSSDLSWTILFWKLKWILRANFVHWREGKQKIRLGPLMEIPAPLKLPFNFEWEAAWIKRQLTRKELKGVFQFWKRGNISFSEQLDTSPSVRRKAKNTDDVKHTRHCHSLYQEYNSSSFMQIR